MDYLCFNCLHWKTIKRRKVIANASIRFLILLFISCCFGLVIYFVILFQQINNFNLVNTSISVEINKKSLHIKEIESKCKDVTNSINLLSSKETMMLAQMDNLIMLRNFYHTENTKKHQFINDLINDISSFQSKIHTYKQEIEKNKEYINTLQSNVINKKNIFENLRSTNIKHNTHNSCNSLIINEEQCKLLSFWINESYQIRMQLLYRGSENNFSIEKFHSVADHNNIKNTLIIIQMYNNIIIGGFTYNNWNLQGFQEDNYAILFNMSNKQYYRVIEGLEAIYSYSKYYGVFGRGDLAIYSKDKVTSSFPSNYGFKANPLELTNGEIEFRLKEIELYTIL